MSPISATVHIPHEDTRFTAEPALPREIPRNGAPVRPSPLVRLFAFLRGNALDLRLIESVDPSDSPLLAARAARLTRPRTRIRLAEGLERLLEAADGPQGRWCAVARREPLRVNSDRLKELARTLRDDQPLYAHGIAIVSDLLGDGTGPAYHGDSELLAQRLDRAMAAMRG